MRTLLNAFLTLWGVVTIVFFLFNVLGDPAQMMVDQNASQAQVKQIQKKYGFNLPLVQQYFYFVNDLSPLSIYTSRQGQFNTYNASIHGGFFFPMGSSFLVIKWPYLRTSYQRQGKPVTEIIGESLPNTILLAVSSIGIAIGIGLLLGILSAFYKGSLLDRFLLVISTLGMSAPSFFSAILFSWFFGYLLHDITGLNMTGSLYTLDDFGEGHHLMLQNLFLPAFVLGIRPLGVIVQLVRSGMIDVMQQEYIKTAYAKGLSPMQVIRRHAIKNMLNPVITAISGWFASMLAGAVFVEYIFGWRGLGKEMVNALNTLDIPIVTGGVLVIATLFVAINATVDYLYTLINPKTKTTL